MKDFSLNFGPVIAFILPGFVVLWGLSHHFATVASWIAPAGSASSISGFLLAILCALGLGLVINGVRSLTLGKLLPAPKDINWKGLTANESTHKAMVLVVENCWHYHLFYGNVFFAFPAALALYFNSPTPQIDCDARILIGMVAVEIVLLCNARQNGKDYYRILKSILG